MPTSSTVPRTGAGGRENAHPNAYCEHPHPEGARLSLVPLRVRIGAGDQSRPVTFASAGKYSAPKPASLDTFIRASASSAPGAVIPASRARSSA